MQLTPPSSPPIGLRPRGPTLGVLVVGLLCTLGLYLWNRHSQELQDQARIRRYTERVETALLNRMGRYEDMVRGAQGFFAQDRDIQPEEWADYVQHLDIAQRHPGLSSLAYIVPVPHADLEDYLARHAELSGKYHLPHADPAYLGDPAEDGVHFLIQLCEPAAQSPGAVGLDVGASRTQRLTAVRARDTGGPALSGLLFFTNGTLRQEAVAFYLPVYRTRALPATEADRRAALKGWVSAGILIRPLVRDILKDEDTGLTFEITDPFSAQGPRWLYVSPDWPINTPPAVVHDLDVAGRDWRMQYALRPAFYRTEGRRRPEWMLLAGLIVTLSLTAGMASLTGTRARALELAGRMTESLHQALVRNRSHMENTPMAVVETDADFLIQEWNPAAERIFGYSRAEVLGRDPRFLVPDEEQASLDRRRKTLQEELGKGVRVTLQVKRPSGEIRLCDWTITALRDERGQFAGAMYLADDITERRRSEEALRQSQKLESLGVLAGGIAHDFNNLLTAVLGNAEVALAQVPPDSPLHAALDRIEAAARRGADLARQLLAYAGKGHFTVAPQNLNRIIREMGDLLAVSISKKVALEYDLQPGIPSVEADSAQFQQVIMNLVINASEAIGDQAGTVTLRTRAITCDRTKLASEFPGQVLEPGPYVRLEVADNGCGMDAETIGRIFDPFFSTKFTGRGLGLSAMLGIVRGHRAGLRVDSRPGEGTTFTLLFPASGRPAPAEPERPAAPVPLRGKVLVADDEMALRDLARGALEAAGLDVLEARDGQEAVELYQKHQDEIDLVFLDMTMPRMGGAEAFRLIREMNPAARVLLTSGYTERESLDTLTDLIPDGFLQKPFRVRDLVSKVREVLALESPNRIPK